MPSVVSAGTFLTSQTHLLRTTLTETSFTGTFLTEQYTHFLFSFPHNCIFEESSCTLKCCFSTLCLHSEQQYRTVKPTNTNLLSTCEGAEAMAQVTQRRCGCSIPGGAQGQVGWVSEQPVLVDSVPVSDTGWHQKIFKVPSHPNYFMIYVSKCFL